MVLNWFGKVLKVLFRINKVMKVCVYEDRLKKFYKCDLVMKIWNENMKIMSKYMKIYYD